MFDQQGLHKIVSISGYVFLRSDATQYAHAPLNTGDKRTESVLCVVTLAL
jgi:hypothetical protein